MRRCHFCAKLKDDFKKSSGLCEKCRKSTKYKEYVKRIKRNILVKRRNAHEFLWKKHRSEFEESI